MLAKDKQKGWYRYAELFCHMVLMGAPRSDPPMGVIGLRLPMHGDVMRAYLWATV